MSAAFSISSKHAMSRTWAGRITAGISPPYLKVTLLPGSGTAPHRSEQVEVEHPFPVGIVRVLKAGVLHRIRLERWELNLSRDTRRSDRVCLQDHDVAPCALCELGVRQVLVFNKLRPTELSHKGDLSVGEYLVMFFLLKVWPPIASEGGEPANYEAVSITNCLQPCPRESEDELTVEFNPHFVARGGAPSELVEVVVRSAKPAIRENEFGRHLVVEKLRYDPRHLADRHQRTHQSGSRFQ